MFKTILEHLVAALQRFFSQDVLGGLHIAAKSSTWEWAPLALAYVLFFALSVPIFAKTAVRHMAASSSVVGKAFSSVISFGGFFGMSLLVAIIAIAMIAAGLFFLVRVVHKKDTTITALLNTVMYASLPLILASLLNMLLSLIWTPLAIFVFLTAVVMQLLLLYNGLQELIASEKPSFYMFSLVSFVCLAVIVGVAGLLYKQCLADTLTSLMSNAIGSLFGNNKSSSGWDNLLNGLF